LHGLFHFNKSNFLFFFWILIFFQTKRHGKNRTDLILFDKA
jgi:hypothetical protein